MSAAIRQARRTLDSRSNSLIRDEYKAALEYSDVIDKLSQFAPRVAGTPPLELDIPESDIDILCHAPDARLFAETVWINFSHYDGFSIWQWSGEGRPIVASYHCAGWRIEIFGDQRPVDHQEAWRHFLIEQRLLALGGDLLRSSVMGRRRRGLKTEAAFAAALNLEGDPYNSLLALEPESDTDLRNRFPIGTAS